MSLFHFAIKGGSRFFFLANSTLNCKHLNGQIFSYLPSLSLKAVVADWALLTPPSLTCPARSSRLLSLPSAAVSRSGKGGGKGKVNRALAQQRDSSTTTTPTISRWHCLRLCCVTFELKCKNRKAGDSMRRSLFACSSDLYIFVSILDQGSIQDQVEMDLCNGIVWNLNNLQNLQHHNQKMPKTNTMTA